VKYYRKLNIYALLLPALFAFLFWPGGDADAGGASEQNDDKNKDSGFVVLPILSYMPETKLAGGALLNYFFRRPPGNSETSGDYGPGDSQTGEGRRSRPSTIMPSAIYTQKKQISSVTG